MSIHRDLYGTAVTGEVTVRCIPQPKYEPVMHVWNVTVHLFISGLDQQVIFILWFCPLSTFKMPNA